MVPQKLFLIRSLFSSLLAVLQIQVNCNLPFVQTWNFFIQTKNFFFYRVHYLYRLIQGLNVKSLRAFRVLRPLRLLSSIPSENLSKKSSLRIWVEWDKSQILLIFYIIHIPWHSSGEQFQVYKLSSTQSSWRWSRSSTSCCSSCSSSSSSPSWDSSSSTAFSTKAVSMQLQASKE